MLFCPLSSLVHVFGIFKSSYSNPVDVQNRCILQGVMCTAKLGISERFHHIVWAAVSRVSLKKIGMLHCCFERSLLLAESVIEQYRLMVVVINFLVVMELVLYFYKSGDCHRRVVLAHEECSNTDVGRTELHARTCLLLVVELFQ